MCKCLIPQHIVRFTQSWTNNIIVLFLRNKNYMKLTYYSRLKAKIGSATAPLKTYCYSSLVYEHWFMSFLICKQYIENKRMHSNDNIKSNKTFNLFIYANLTWLY